jgi:hypothetical protein
MRLIVLFVFFSINSFSQVEEKNFVGNWYYIKTDRRTKEITLRRAVKTYGISLSLNEDNSIREHYSAPCGNDMQFFRSAKKGKGKWNYNSVTRILTSSIPIIYSGKSFKLISFFDNKIVLKSLINVKK